MTFSIRYFSGQHGSFWEVVDDGGLVAWFFDTKEEAQQYADEANRPQHP